MDKNIPIQVEKRMAWTGWPGYIVCGNTGYTITFTFDDEWDGVTAKTARFKFRTDEGMKHTDQPFTGNTVEVPVLSNIREVEVGVFAGDLTTTTGATIRCVPSILCDSGEATEYEKQRFDELMQMFNDLLHRHDNKKTLDLFYCESLETGFATDISSTELKWRGMPVAFDFAGSKVSMVQEVEKNGKLYYRLWFTHSTLSVALVPDYIDIPILGVTNVEEEQGPDITLNGSELDLGLGGTGSGGIQPVTALPETANEGDVVYYCPPANRLTSADSNKEIYLNFAEFERLKLKPENELLDFQIQYSNRADNTPIIHIGSSAGTITFVYSNSPKNKEYWLLWEMNYQTQEYEFSTSGSYMRDGENFSYLTKPFDYFIIDEIIDGDITLTDIGEMMGSSWNWQSYALFYTEPRFYRFTDGKWVEILTPQATVNTDDIWTAIDEIRGGIDEAKAIIDETNALIDNSGVLE